MYRNIGIVVALTLTTSFICPFTEAMDYGDDIVHIACSRHVDAKAYERAASWARAGLGEVSEAGSGDSF